MLDLKNVYFFFLPTDGIKQEQQQQKNLETGRARPEDFLSLSAVILPSLSPGSKGHREGNFFLGGKQIFGGLQRKNSNPRAGAA